MELACIVPLDSTACSAAIHPSTSVSGQEKAFLDHPASGDLLRCKLLSISSSNGAFLSLLDRIGLAIVHFIPSVGPSHRMLLSCDGLFRCHLVCDLCDVSQCQDSMGKAGRHPEDMTILTRQVGR
jgi:hypothetical protein